MKISQEINIFKMIFFVCFEIDFNLFFHLYVIFYYGCIMPRYVTNSAQYDELCDVIY